MVNVTFANVIEALMAACPELIPAFDDYKRWASEAPPPHVFYGTEFSPRLIAALNNPSEHADFLSRAFTLLESLAGAEDILVEEVVVFSVVENLMEDEAVLEKAKPYMGPNLLRILEEI